MAPDQRIRVAGLQSACQLGDAIGLIAVLEFPHRGVLVAEGSKRPSPFQMSQRIVCIIDDDADLRDQIGVLTGQGRLRDPYAIPEVSIRWLEGLPQQLMAVDIGRSQPQRPLPILERRLAEPGSRKTARPQRMSMRIASFLQVASSFLQD